MNDESKARGGSDKRKLAYIPVTAVVCAGVVLSIIIFAVSRQWERRRIRGDLERAARTQVFLFKEQADLHKLELKSVAAFFAGSIEVERVEFSTFVNVFLGVSMDVHSLAWAPRVKRGEVSGYVDAAVGDGLSDFRITERRANGQPVDVGSRAEYFPIFYIEPFKTNASIMGLDIASDSEILEALKGSRRSGRQTATPKLEMLSEKPEDPVFLIVQPVYYRGSATDTEESRAANLQGFAVGIFHVGEMLEGTLAILAEAQIDLFTYDETAAEDKRFLYGHVPGPEQEAGSPEISQAEIQTGLYYSESFAVADRRWRIVCIPAGGFVEARETAQPWWNLSGGLFVTAVVGIYLLSLVRRGEHVRQLVKCQTASLEREVADHKRAEESLALRNRAISEATNGIVITEHHNTFENPIVYVNPAFERITGYSLRDAAGCDCRFLQDDDRDQPGLAEVRQALRQQRGCCVEIRNYRKDGSMFWNELSISPVREEDGRVSHYVAIISDITERKHAEEQLRDLSSALESRNKELQTYATIVRHDLGNQLLSVNAFNSVLAKSCRKLGRLLETQKLEADVRKQVFSVLKDEIARTTDHIKVGTGQMSWLLEGLKRLGEVGYVELQIEPLDMNRLIGEVVETMEAQIDSRAASVAVEELPGCLGDRSMVTQVFSNLLTNAVKYLAPERKGLVRVWGVVEGDVSKYCVQDNGTGISAEEQDRIFEAFYRVDANNPASGEGLGLSIVVRILERLNGKIHVESEPGKGSRFYVVLPKG